MAGGVYKAQPSSMMNNMGVYKSTLLGSAGYDQGLLSVLCLPSWCGRYLQSSCSVARFFRAADALAFLCHCSGYDV